MSPAFDSTYEERAAIMQYLGGLPRAEAENKAHRICYHRTEVQQRRDGSTSFTHTLVAPKELRQQEPRVEEQLELISREQYLAGIKRFL